MNKAVLRTEYKTRRSALLPSTIAKFDDLLLINFQRLAIQVPAIILGYAASEARTEFDPVNIHRYCNFMHPGLIYGIPVVSEESGMMEAIEVNADTEYKLNRYGIAEPVGGERIDPGQIDMVLLPLLCFDRKGYRVGYGKGYYDRFLARCSADVVKIGFSYFEPIDEISDVHMNDIRMDHCVTPENIYTFN
jgi:5-formyltetrahydrofolate cyclo-ligase